ELMETLARWAYSGWLAAMLVPTFALAESVRRYWPFQDEISPAKAAGESHNGPPTDAAAKMARAVLRCADIFPPTRMACHNAGIPRCRVCCSSRYTIAIKFQGWDGRRICRAAGTAEISAGSGHAKSPSA